MDGSGSAYEVLKRRRRYPNAGRAALGPLQRGPLTATRLMSDEVLVGKSEFTPTFLSPNYSLFRRGLYLAWQFVSAASELFGLHSSIYRVCIHLLVYAYMPIHLYPLSFHLFPCLSVSLPGHAGCVNRLCWHEGGDLLASTSDDRRVLLWDVSVDNSRDLGAPGGLPEGFAASRSHRGARICRPVRSIETGDYLA